MEDCFALASGGVSIPWNAMADGGKLAPGIPKSNFWASDPSRINQVGYLYTAQGFEFDYVGAIFGSRSMPRDNLTCAGSAPATPRAMQDSGVRGIFHRAASL
jgi:DUF2075 family protein